MLNNSKSKMKILSVTLVLILVSLMAAVFLCNTPTAAAEDFKPSNFVTARKTGTLNGILQKQPDGSVTFNGEMIASAEEDLSQMYVILQGAGGAGGNRYIYENSSSGGSGAFALVLIKFISHQDVNGNIFYLPVKISSGLGGKMATFGNNYLIREGVDSVVTIDNIGSISATTGLSAHTCDIYPTPGGEVIVNSIFNSITDYMEVVYQKNGYTSGDDNTSHIFTVAMYKNGGWLSLKTFGTFFGGDHSGGGASPYSKGGDGANAGLLSKWSYPENAPSYGAGGGGTSPLLHPTDPECDESKFGTGGSGGDGFIEILG